MINGLVKKSKLMMPLVSGLLFRCLTHLFSSPFFWTKNMHYYQFNIGDYTSHTKHLTPIEDICYRRLLDWYYLHEKPIPKDINSVARMLILNGCLTEVEQVLNEFFVLSKNGWINARADKEIKEYQNKISANSRAGKISAEKRKSYNQRPLNVPSTDVQPNNNQEPLTINQEPLTNLIGAISKKIIDTGINPTTINQANPTFIALVEAGATLAEFEFAAMEAKRKNQGFNYVLGIVKGERERAKVLDIHKGKIPENLSAKDAARKSVIQAAFGNLLNQYKLDEKDITNEPPF